MLSRSPRSCAGRNILSKRVSTTGRLFLQIGAGAGNLDPRSQFSDGFTEFVKGMELNVNDRLALVGPNPGNVDRLNQCWSDLESAEIVQMAVLPRGEVAREMTLWFAVEDGPHFQVASSGHGHGHVERLYPQGTIESMEVPAIPIDLLIEEIRRETSLELLAIDVEGMDAEILRSMNWASADFYAVSFESPHMGDGESVVHRRLHEFGYVSAGVGLDLNGLDSLVLKTETLRRKVLARVWELERQANLSDVDGKPWSSLLYLINWFRTRGD
jgi:hypothetical protein